MRVSMNFNSAFVFLKFGCIALKKTGRDSTASKQTTRASIASTSRTTGRSDSTTTTKSTASTTKGSTSKRDREVEKFKGKANGKDRGKEKGKSKQIDSDVEIKEEEEEEEEEHEDEEVRHLADPKGMKRKYSETQSANSSANQTSGRGGTVDVEADDGESEEDEEVETSMVGRKKRVITTRPRKKRRIVLREAYDEALRNQPKGQGRSRGKGPAQDEEDVDEEERMVEEVLSQGLVSPGRDAASGVDAKYYDDEADMGSDFDMPDAVPDIGGGQDYSIGNDEENEAEEESKEMKVQSKSKGKPALVSASAEDDDEDDDDDIETTDGAYPATIQIDGKAPNGKLARITTTNPHTLASDNNAKKTLVSLESTMAATKRSKKGGGELASESESDSGGPPPLEWNWEGGGRRPEPREQEGPNGRLTRATIGQDSDVVAAVAVPKSELGQEQAQEMDEEVAYIESDPENRAILSPRARSRLVRFDIEVMGKKPDEARERLKDGRGMKAKDTDTSLKELALLVKEGSGTRPMSAKPTVVPAIDPSLPTISPELSLLSRKFQRPRTYYHPADVEVEGEVVPETEAENSQSQSRSQSQPQFQEIVKEAKISPAAGQASVDHLHVDEPLEPNVLPPAQSRNLAGGAEEEEPPLPLPSPTPSVRFTLLKTTALRLPEGTNGHGNGHSAGIDREKPLITTAATKPLRPLPPLSPSVFRAHFVEQLEPPASSLPDSIVEPSSSNERGLRVVVEAIEEFDSPDKRVRSESGFGGNKDNPKRVLVMLEKKRCPKDTESGGSLEMKGLERKEKEGQEQRKKKTLEDIIAHVRGRSLSVDSDDEEQVENEEDVADASTTVIPPASGPPASVAGIDSQLEEPREETIERMEEEYMDLSGGMGMDVDVDDETMDGACVRSGEATNVDIRLLRQEEEESSQDIMAEMRALEERQLGVDVSAAPAPVAVLDDVNADAQREMPQVN